MGEILLTRFIIVGISSGILFGILDALINANPMAQRLYNVFKPISKTTINPVAGILIDLFYGFVMAWIFLLLYISLPGETGILKGLSFGVIVWFFRVFMYSATQWMIFNIPKTAIAYTLITGFFEMLILGTFYGLTLN